MRTVRTCSLAASVYLSLAAGCGSRPPPAHDVASIDAVDAAPDVLAPDVPAADVPTPDVAMDDHADAPSPDVDDAFDATLDGGYTDASDVVLFADAACNARYAAFPPDPGIHIDPEAGVTIVWSTNPPSSGEHYPEWATWGVHTDVVPRPNYVHNLEHGGVVIQFRCDGDCASIRAQLTDFVDGLPPESECVGSGVARRIVLTEDPLIDAPVTASAWGWTYHADCYDPSSLAAFVFARTGMGTEDFCTEGSVP